MPDSNGHVMVRIGGVDHQGQKTGRVCQPIDGNLPVLEVISLDDGNSVKVTQCCGVIPEIVSRGIADLDACSGVTLNLALKCNCGTTHGTARG